jgi:hypothetical protein
MSLITLRTWAELHYPDDQPCDGTLQYWARNGNIYPPPEKQGRSYRVHPEAFYIKPNKAEKTLTQHHPNGRVGIKSPLLEKLMNEHKTRS